VRSLANRTQRFDGPRTVGAADPYHRPVNAEVPVRVDVAVVGGGPAGRALTSRAAAVGLTTAVLDPDPHRPWPATYGIWTDEIPTWLPDDVVGAAMPEATARARTLHHLGRAYSMLDTAALQVALTADDGTTAVRRAAVGTRPAGRDTAVLLDGGGEVRARVVVDASGPRRVLSALPAAGARAAQTAFGVVLPDDGRIAHTFMDWTADHGEDGWPSFLYAVPLGGGRLLLEETSLARRPGLDVAILRRRLRAKLAARGVEVDEGAATELVAFPVDIPPTRGVGATVAFGAAAGVVHPATGYSLATSLVMADPVVAALADAMGDPDPHAPARAARQVVWSARARAVHHLRRRGLEVLLALPPEGVVDFFELFFSLPRHHQHAYLTARDDLVAVRNANWAVFRGADGTLRRHLLRWGVRLIGDHRAGPTA
jgi:lycopene beta-cyclase